MCGIVGFVNLKQELKQEEYKHVLSTMLDKIAKRGPDEDGYFLHPNAMLGHKRLIVVDPNGGAQPMSCKFQDNTYTIVYNGQLYNTNDLKEELISNGFTFETHSDTEVLLKSYIHFGNDVLHKLNGIFAFSIWNEKKQELFFARDHFGVKPFYYSIKNHHFVFASEVKSLFAFPGISATIEKEGICELFGLGPCHTAGNGIFKDIFELRPAHFGIYNRDGLHIKRYWKLESKPHTDSFGTTCEKVRYLLEDSIKRQLVSDVPLCTFLSGGLDSSIITLYASNYCKEHGLPPLTTFSVDYVDNDKNFQKTDFQPNSDKFYIDIMQQKLNTNHKTIILDTPELATALEDAMIARDYPRNGRCRLFSSSILQKRKARCNSCLNRRMC